jgi:pyrroline-5-carboxylate reductase
MKVGFIGYVNMSGAVVRAFLRGGSLEQGDVVVFNRTAARLNELKMSFPGVTLAPSAKEVVARCDVLFLGIRTAAVGEVMVEGQTRIKFGRRIGISTSRIRLNVRQR